MNVCQWNAWGQGPPSTWTFRQLCQHKVYVTWLHHAAAVTLTVVCSTQCSQLLKPCTIAGRSLAAHMACLTHAQQSCQVKLCATCFAAQLSLLLCCVVRHAGCACSMNVQVLQVLFSFCRLVFGRHCLGLDANGLSCSNGLYLCREGFAFYIILWTRTNVFRKLFGFCSINLRVYASGLQITVYTINNISRHAYIYAYHVWSLMMIVHMCCMNSFKCTGRELKV